MEGTGERQAFYAAMIAQADAAAREREAYWEFLQGIRPGITRETFEQLWTSFLKLRSRRDTSKFMNHRGRAQR